MRKRKVAYVFKSRQKRFNHLLFVDNLKLYGRNESPFSSLVDKVYAFSTHIKIVVGLKRCNVFVLKRIKIRCDTDVGGYDADRRDGLKELWFHLNG